MRNRAILISFFVVTLFHSPVSAQDSTRREMSLTNIEFDFGGLYLSGANGSIENFQKLFPQSRILSNLTHPSSPFSAVTPNARSNVFSALADFKIHNEGQDSIWTGFAIRTGVSYISGSLLNNTYTHSDVLQVDSVTLQPNGPTMRLDSVQNTRVEMNYFTQTALLRLGALYKFGRTNSILNLIVGMEASVGLSFNSYTELEKQSQNGIRWGLVTPPEPYRERLSEWRYADGEKSETEEKQLTGAITCVLRIDANPFAHQKMSDFYISFAVSPSMHYNPIPRLEQDWIFGLRNSFGLGYRLK